MVRRKIAREASKMTSRLTYFGDLLVVGVTCFVIWQGLHWTLGTGVLASPMNVYTALTATLAHAGFWEHAGATMRALLAAAALSLAGGILLGLFLGVAVTLGAVFEPLLVSFYALPKVTLYPLILLVCGLGLSAKIAFGVLHGLIPVCLITMNAVRQIPQSYLRTARILRLTPMQTISHIIVPAVSPTILSSVRLGFSLSLLGVLIGEMFAAKAGLGFLIMNAIAMNDMATLLALTFLLFAFALSVNWALGYVIKLASMHRPHATAN
jgi:NitT/TauT family transport system permease protein